MLIRPRIIPPTTVCFPRNSYDTIWEEACSLANPYKGFKYSSWQVAVRIELQLPHRSYGPLPPEYLC